MQRQYTLKTALPCLSAYTTRDMMVIQIYDTHALPRPRAWLCVICDWTRACGVRSRCKCTYYCGTECQEASWPMHKSFCKKKKK